MDPIAQVRARMAELKPEMIQLADVETHDDTQKARYTAITEEWDQLEARQAELEERKARLDKAAKVLPDDFGRNDSRDVLVPSEIRDMQSIGGPEARARALDMVERSRRFASDDDKQAVTTKIERGGSFGNTVARLALATASDEYRDAWTAYLAGRQLSGDQYALLERAMTAGTGSSGGFFVPLYLDPTMLLTGAGTYNDIRSLSNVKQITTLIYNGVSAAQVTASVLGENAAFADNTPVASQIQITTYKMGAYIPASFEAFEDIENLTNDVGELFMDARANLEAQLLTTGTGSSQPKGVVTAVTAVTASRVAPATGGAFVVGDVYSTHQALPPRYRRGEAGSTAFLASVNVINAMRQFATANVYHAFLTDLTGGQPPNLIGTPLHETSDMATAITTGNNVLLFGDFRRYYVIDRIGVQTEFIPNVFDQATARPTGTRAWLMHWRMGADVADVNGFRILKL